MADIERLVLASANPGKLREFTRLLAAAVGAVVAQEDLGVAPAAEPYGTFIENALAKARAAAAATCLPALADDSGLCVAALAGAPGVHSARYADDQDDAANNAKLLQELRDHADRRAHYHCALVLCQSADDPAPLIAEGRWYGAIAKTPAGDGGFGYDPLFVLADGQTAAQLPPATKDACSHRGLAVRRLLELLATQAD